jgi:hypothetical protein
MTRVPSCEHLGILLSGFLPPQKNTFCSWHSIIRGPLFSKTTFFTLCLLVFGTCQKVKNLSNALSWGIIRNILLVGESLHSYCYYRLSLKADLFGNDF